MDLDCKIYICSDMDFSSFLNIVHGVFGGELRGRNIFKDTMSLSLMLNPFYKSGSEDFVEWRYYLDVEPSYDVVEIDSSGYISCLVLIFNNLKNLGFYAVPCCDFEDSF